MSSLNVEWSDKHKSSFTFEWIRQNVVRTHQEAKVKKQPWKAEDIKESLVSCTFEKLMSDEETLSKSSFINVIY